jgi:hypothetical protein
VPHLVALPFELVAKHKNDKAKDKLNQMAHLNVRTTTMKKQPMRKQTHHVVCTF